MGANRVPGVAWFLALVCVALLVAAPGASCSSENWTVCVLKRPPVSYCNSSELTQYNRTSWLLQGGFAVDLFTKVRRGRGPDPEVCRAASFSGLIERPARASARLPRFLKTQPMKDICRPTQHIH